MADLHHPTRRHSRCVHTPQKSQNMGGVLRHQRMVNTGADDR
jgi:hypothetical protein